MSERPFDQLSPNDFEFFCRALLVELGFQRLHWRQGGRDRGRDIVAELLTTEPDGTHVIQRWFIECKHYAEGHSLGVSDLLTKVAWADAEQPDYLLFLTTSYLTPDAKDWIASIEKQKRFRIRYWEGPRLAELVPRFPVLSEIYLEGRSQYRADGVRRKLLERLLEDFKSHTSGDNSVELEEVLGDPPDRLLMLLRCESVIDFAQDGAPIIGNEHRILLSIPSDYPMALPQVRVLTPILHPHVYPSHEGLVCYGYRDPMESLYVFVKQIQRLLSYQGVDFSHAVNRDSRIGDYLDVIGQGRTRSNS